MTSIKNPPHPILIVDDHPVILATFQKVLGKEGLNNVVTCQDSHQVMALMAAEDFEIVLLDLNMPQVDGETLLSQIHVEYPEVPVIIITADEDVKTVVRCMKQGAHDYLNKEVGIELLVSTVHRALEYRSLNRENMARQRNLRPEALRHPEAFRHIITQNAVMFALFEYIETISHSRLPMLVTGETGVGKELIARAIHQASGMEGKFVAVNVAGLDEHLFADTLFGHVRGAFTGAGHARSGLLEKAIRGTLFLDEIGELSPNSQLKLLRLLQEGEYFPLGADAPKKSLTRIVAATNRDLMDAVQTKGFRKDLLFRLKKHHVFVPPLRERKEDLPLLLEHFLHLAAQESGKKPPWPPKELLTLLENYAFPGNVREFQGMVYDVVARHRRGVLSLEVFKDHIKAGESQWEQDSHAGIRNYEPMRFGDRLPTIKEATAFLVEEALRRTRHNRSQAAEMLGVTPQALCKRLKNRNLSRK